MIENKAMMMMAMMKMMIRRQCFIHGQLQQRSTIRLLDSLCAQPARSGSTSSESLSSRLGPEPSAVGYNDYEAERRTFKLEQPEFYNFATDVIDRWTLNEQVTSRHVIPVCIDNEQ